MESAARSCPTKHSAPAPLAWLAAVVWEVIDEVLWQVVQKAVQEVVQEAVQEVKEVWLCLCRAAFSQVEMLSLRLIDQGSVGSTDSHWEGYHESRRCSRDTYPESYTTKYTSIRR